MTKPDQENLLNGAMLPARALVMLLIACQFTFAEPPTVSYLYPAGAQRGTDTTVQCSGSFDWPVKVWCSTGTVSVEDEKGRLTISVPQDCTTDRIWLRLYNEDGATSPFPFLVGDVNEISEEEPNDSPNNGHTVATKEGVIAATINGKLQKTGDVDSFAVPLETGQTLVAAVAANTPFGSPMDAILQVVTPSGTVLAENHDAIGLDPRLAFTCTTPGIHVVRIFAFPAAPNQQIRFHGGDSYVYRLTLTNGPFVSHAGPMAVTLLEADDVPTELVEPRGWNIPANSQLPIAYLDKNDGGTETEIEAAQIGQWQSSHIGFVNSHEWAGSCRIRIVPYSVVTTTESTTPEAPLTLTPPIAVSGTIRKRSDTDYFRVSLKRDVRYQFVAESVSLGSPLVPALRLEDDKGKIVSQTKENGPADDATLSYQAATDGEYLLTIRDRFSSGGLRYFYRLSILPQLANFELKLASDSFVISTAKPLEIPVEITRHAGEGGSIEDVHVEAIDLPPGVTTAAVISKSQGESAKKVVLRLESDGTKFSGPIRIRGTAAAQNMERFAATPPRFNACFDSSWLTVRQPAD